MPPLSEIAAFLRPYTAEPLIAALCAATALLYFRGLSRGEPPGNWAIAGFIVGLGSMYLVTQTRFDYFAQYLFFMHRVQHLVLHHVGPMLIVLANPLPILVRALPERPRHRAQSLWHSAPISVLYKSIQHPAPAGFLFVGLIYFWLIPSIHFDAMLSRFQYNLMNWTMAVDGILFWWLVLNPRAPDGANGSLGYGKRCLLLALVMFPQILIGAYIALSDSAAYGIYEVCGRPWPIQSDTDQTLAGLITWIPASMMSVVGMLIVLSRWQRHERAQNGGPDGTGGRISTVGGRM